MYRSRLLSIALGLACSVSLAAQEGDKKPLRYTFEKGSTGHYVIEHSINVDASGQGQQMKQTGKVQTFASFRVDEVKDGTAHVITEFTRVTMDMKMPMMNVKFDTDDEDSMSGQFERVLDILGKPIESEIDARGNIKVTKVPDELQGGAAAMLDAESVLKQFQAVLPESAIAVGETWDTSSPQPFGPMGSLDMKAANKLTSLDANSAKIAQTLSLGDVGDEMPVKPMVDSGTCNLAVNLHEVMPTTGDLALDMSMDVPAGHGEAMKMKIKTTMTLKRTEAPKKKDAQEAEKKEAAAEKKEGGDAEHK